MSQYSSKEIVTWQTQIKLRIKELELLQNSAQASTSVVTLDQAKVGRLSRMDAMQGQAMAKATDIRRQKEVKLLERALLKLAKGEFGECEECLEVIDPRRLRNNPAVVLCLSCAENAERD